MEYDYLYKIIILGDSGAGKTSIINRFLDNNNPPLVHDPTIGIDFRVKPASDINLDGTIIKLHIWDTAGQENYKSIIESYYKGIAAAIIVFDLTSYQSFKNVQYWLNELSIHSNTNIRQPIVLIGNKNDLGNKRQVLALEAETFANENNLLYFETSVTKSININESIQALVSAITKKYIDGNIHCDGVKTGIRIESSNLTREDCCRDTSLLNCCKPS